MNLPRHAEIWLPGYLASRWRRMHAAPARRAWLMVADHFEPLRGNATVETGRARVRPWVERWPAIASRHRDSAGRPPVYTFFYPEEEYRPAFLDSLAALADRGLADVEIHIHHDGEGQRNFVDRMSGFMENLRFRHGLLRQEDGRTVFGFIHGNWALDNSLPGGRRCGLNNEITLLRELGCYADFTLPSAPSAAQTRMVNAIYWAKDDPARPKSHDTGVPVEPGGPVAGDVLMIPGPLGLNWRERSRGFLPRLETGELAGHNPVTRERARLWLACAPRIGPDVFIKLFAHGALEANTEALLGRDLDAAFACLTEGCNEAGCELRFVSAWQMRQAVEAARLSLNPAEAPAAIHAGL